jgi:hypothetical protein
MKKSVFSSSVPVNGFSFSVVRSFPRGNPLFQTSSTRSLYMTTPQKSHLTEFVAFYVKSRGRREQLRFLPKCAECGKVLFDVAQANIAVIDDDGTLGRPKREGGATFREIGSARLFCWGCDREQSGAVPWLNALSTFRGLDEPQRFPEPIRGGRPR